MKMKGSTLVLLTSLVLISSGCSKKECTAESVETDIVKEAVLQKVEVSQGDTLVYIPVTAAAASSFDQTPDWAPEPNPMAPVDGDMLTRWSSDYLNEDEWISFDFGKESVVSDIIVRWERAHSRKYKILASNDASRWQEVYAEENGKSGAVETIFSPVKCRYVKIFNVEKVNEDWGISIWEAEFYGPASLNPHATVTKDAYLSKGADEAKAKEAKELLAKLVAPVVPISEKPFQKGVVYTSWMADELAVSASDIMLAYIKGTGLDTVAIMVPAYQDELNSEIIFTNDKPDGDTPTIESLKHAVEICHKLGLRVMIKPHVDPRTDEARIDIMASEKWFDSYEEFILRYARFSAENKVEIFCIGTELEATTFSAWTHRWSQLIAKVKEAYKGTLTYAANWTEYAEVPFWEDMDFIGIDAYFPLTEKDDPTREELVAAWNANADKLEEWLTAKGLTDKGIVLTEIGYPSANGANRQPWVAISNVEDQQEQADCLSAVFEALTKRSWFKGYYIWQYFPQDRWSPLGFTVKGKKAEEVINEWAKKG